MSDKIAANEIEFDGLVIEVLPGSVFRVRPLSEDGKPIEGDNVLVTAYACGKIRKHRIKIFLKDKVRVVVSTHDLKKGRIILRHEKSKD